VTIIRQYTAEYKLRILREAEQIKGQETLVMICLWKPPNREICVFDGLTGYLILFQESGTNANIS